MTREEFLKKFDLFANFPEAVERIRQLILALATRGRLVEQRDDEGTADQLRRTIELERRDANKLYRRPATSRIDIAPIADLPSTWASVLLHEVVHQIQYGYTASANADLSAVRMLRITDIQENRVNWPLVPGCEIDDTEIGKYLLRENDIIIARTGGTIGKSFIISGEIPTAVFASYLIRVTPPKSIEAQYLKRFLESPGYWEQLRAASAGTGQPNVNGQALGMLVVPLPPLAEQKRIVAKVNELMALCDRLEAQQKERETRHAALARASLAHFADAPTPANLTFLFHKSYTIPAADLRKLILALAVRGKLVLQDVNDELADQLLRKIAAQRAKLLSSNSIRKGKPCRQFTPEEVPYDIPQMWTWTLLGEIADVGTGSTPSRTEPSFWKGGTVPWITSGSTSRSPITQGDDLVTLDAVRTHRLQLYPPGTLLVALYGQGKTRGQVATLGISATINQACAAIRPLDGIPSMQDYLKLLLEKQYDEMRLLSAGGAQPNLNVQKIKEIFVPLPPLAEQRRIVAKVDQLMALVDEMQAQVAASRATAAKLLDAIVSELTAFAPRESTHAHGPDQSRESARPRSSSAR